MNGVLKALQNSNTTVAGLILAVLTYTQEVGANLPSGGDEWTATLVAMALAAFGVLAKDGKTGSSV